MRGKRRLASSTGAMPRRTRSAVETPFSEWPSVKDLAAGSARRFP